MIDALKRNWSYFAWSWAFVAWAVLVGMTVDALGFGRAFFWMSTPLFFYCFFRGTRPWFRGSATYIQTVVWAMLAPFLLAMPLAALWHAFAFLLRRATSSF